MIHCYPASPPGLSDHSDPVAIEKMVRVFHKTKFVVAHFGGEKHFDDMPNLNHHNVYFETSGVLPVLIQYLEKDKIGRVFEGLGHHKIMFGSDFSTADLDQTIEILKELIPREELENVMAKNILRFGKQFGWWQERERG